MPFNSQQANEQEAARTIRFGQIPGEMAELVRKTDWSSTVLGPMESWPETLLATVAMLLSAQIPMQLFWGAEMITLYNDAMRQVVAEKHPMALGVSRAQGLGGSLAGGGGAVGERT